MDFKRNQEEFLYKASLEVKVSEVKSVWKKSMGDTPWRLAVWSRLGKMLWFLMPHWDLVPNDNFLKITICLRDCSAWLLVGCTPLCLRKVKSECLSGPVKKVLNVSAGLNVRGFLHIFKSFLLSCFPKSEADSQGRFPWLRSDAILQASEHKEIILSQKRSITESLISWGKRLCSLLMSFAFLRIWARHACQSFPILL